MAIVVKCVSVLFIFFEWDTKVGNWSGKEKGIKQTADSKRQSADSLSALHHDFHFVLGAVLKKMHIL
jgi:hypothetical protein